MSLQPKADGADQAEQLLDLVKSREHMLAQQLTLEQKQFERLKSDFKYNLSLLRERDAELEKYDVEMAAVRSELEQRVATIKATRAELTKSQKQLDEEQHKNALLQEEMAEGETKARAVQDQLSRKAADVARLQDELDVALKERSEALSQATKAQGEAAEKSQEVHSVRNELTLRLQILQQQLDDAEDSHRSNLAEERAQHASQAKQARSEAMREASALQEQIDKLQAEAAEQTRSHAAAVDELKSLREAQVNEQQRASRQREDVKRLNASVTEMQDKVIVLTRQTEQQDLAAKRTSSEHAASLQRQAEEHARSLAAEKRQCEAREAAAERTKEEGVAAAKRGAEGRIAKLEADVAQERARVASHANSVAAAEERARAQTARADQLQAEKSGLARDASALRAEAVSSRERGDVMQKMLNQRTEYMRKLQAAAAKREEQLAAQYGERERSSVDAAEQKLAHEVAAREEIVRQLAEKSRLHADAERRVAVLQGTLFATSGSPNGVGARGTAPDMLSALEAQATHDRVASLTPGAAPRTAATASRNVGADRTPTCSTPSGTLAASSANVETKSIPTPSFEPLSQGQQTDEFQSSPRVPNSSAPPQRFSSMTSRATDEYMAPSAARPVDQFTVAAVKMRDVDSAGGMTPAASVVAVPSNPSSRRGSTTGSQRASQQPSPTPPFKAPANSTEPVPVASAPTPPKAPFNGPPPSPPPSAADSDQQPQMVDGSPISSCSYELSPPAAGASAAAAPQTRSIRPVTTLSTSEDVSPHVDNLSHRVSPPLPPPGGHEFSPTQTLLPRRSAFANSPFAKGGAGGDPMRLLGPGRAASSPSASDELGRHSYGEDATLAALAVSPECVLALSGQQAPDSA
jgi:hypothetical protein